MKNLKHLFIALAVILTVGVSANAQFKIGPRVGINVNSMHFNEKVFESENRTGFNAGLQTEFTIPLVGIGFDASLMYVRRTNEFTGSTKHCDYFEIPVNLKWKMGIPVIEKVVKPYIFTGPSFAFLTSKRAISDAMKYKTVDTSWNVGLGFEFISHLQIGAYYGFGINNAIETFGNAQTSKIDGKTHCWTVTAAWLF